MHVALVEDEAKLAATLKEGLGAEGYTVSVFPDGESADEELATNSADYALLILDLNLPQMSGIDVCRNLRAQGSTLPVLALTARDSIDDKVSALDSGADDFLTKPFVFEELMARMRAVTRRSIGFTPEKLTAQDIVVDITAREATRAGTPISLSPTELDLLCLLMRTPGRTISRDEISMHLWNLKDPALSNVVDVHISNLRKKLHTTHGQECIHTVRGAGYTIQK